MWTKAQQAAIDIKKGSILVSAAAGTCRKNNKKDNG